MTKYTKEMSISEIIKELYQMRNDLASMTNAIEAIIKNLVVIEHTKGGDTK